MAIAVDSGFAERLRRIESGKQWSPAGVVMPKNRGRRRKVDINRGSRRMTYFLVSVLLGGIWLAFSSVQPDLAEQFLAGGSSLIGTALEAVADG